MKFFKYSVKQRASLAMAFTLVASNGMYINANQVNVKKLETVYVNLYPDGKSRQIIVSDWLKDSGQKKQISESTNLEDISNLSKVSHFTKESGSLKWKDPHEDIIYQGKINKSLPVDTQITYYLNDEQISPEDIAGKSGKVKIKIKFKNNTFSKKYVDGKFEEVATPFTAIVVAGFDSEKFSNIHADNSKIFSDGNNQMLMFMGFPGLKKSLNIQNSSIDQIRDIDLPEEFTINADAKDFELETIAVALTPELPDFLKKIDNIKDADQIRKDIDTMINANNTIKEKDKTDSIKNLIKDEKKTADARRLVDDLYDYYDLDTSIARILPDYVNEENVKLYDKIRADLDDVDIRYVLDNQVLRYIPDRLTDEQIDKVRPIIVDYDEIKTIDTDRFDKAIDLIDQYQDVKDMIFVSSDLYDSLKEHDEDLENLEKATKYTNRIFDLLDDAQAATHGSLTQSDVEYMVKALADKKMQDASYQFKELLPENETDRLNPEQQKKLSVLLDQSIRSGQIGTTTGAQLQAMVKSGHVKNPYRTIILEKFTQGAQRQIINDINEKTTEVRKVLNTYVELQRDLERDFGYSYKSELRQSLNYIDSIMPMIRTLRDQQKKHESTIDDAIDLLKNEDDMEYYTYWAHRAKEMKKDMDDNEKNVEIMKDLLNEYDDPKIRYMYSKIPVLREDFDQARPILEDFSDKIKLPQYDNSFHESPKTIRTLVSIMDHLDEDKYIADTLNLALSDEIVEVARNVIEVIDRRDKSGDIDSIKTKFDDIDDTLNRKNEIVTLSDAYNSFTNSDIKNSSVNFVMKTDRIEVPEQEEPFVPKQQENKSFFKWLSGFFSKKDKTK